MTIARIYDKAVEQTPKNANENNKRLPSAIYFEYARVFEAVATASDDEELPAFRAWAPRANSHLHCRPRACR